jgi:branched-chain amino acid transport system ATP-binding protein
MVAVAAVGPLLETVSLTRVFGGLQAVRSVDLRLDPGEVRAIIGPNGAGKTTLVGMVCGRVRPTSGRVLFRGQDITRLDAHARARLGIVYTFQMISIFKNLTVAENVALAAQRRLMGSLREHLAVSRRELAERVDAALALVALPRVAARAAGSLPYGHQRLLEVAMALASRPEVLMLDEPTQGLGPEEIAALSALIKRVSRDITVVLIEHNMAVVLDLAHRITVMDGGRIIAEGAPREIEANHEVRKVYLGV